MEPAINAGEWYIDQSNPSAWSPRLAVDPGSLAFKGRLYIVRIDRGNGRSAVLLQYSDDTGKTWSRPTIVDGDHAFGDANQSPDSIGPSIAVNQRGVVVVGWADRRDHSDNRGWWYRAAASLDGGVTFSPSVKVSTASNEFGDREVWPLEPSVSSASDRLIVNVGLNGFISSMGHTVDMVTDADGVFHAFWIDNRTTVPQVWTAQLKVDADGRRVPAEVPDGWREVTDQVELRLLESSYDRSSNVVRLAVRLRNIGRRELFSPLRLHLGAIESIRLATPFAGSSSADNRMWEASALSGPVLSPGAESGDVKMEFVLLRPLSFFRPGERLPANNLYSLITLSLRAFEQQRSTADVRPSSQKRQ
jgi:hypothetical protein